MRLRTALAPFIAATACLLSTVAVAPVSAHAGLPTGTETRRFEPGEESPGGITPPRSNKPSRVPSKNVPRPTPLAVSSDPSAKRAEGLDFADQRTSNGGNSFSIEPPDQALCVGSTEVIEGVNNVFATYSKGGALRSGPQSYDPFWNNGTAEFDRTTGLVGPFVSDPKCYWDPGVQRFFMTELQLGQDPETGDFTGDSFENIAVSKGTTPSTSASDWHLFQINVRNDGTHGTPSHPGCPCLGDQPLIGADGYGFYVTTNEFPIEGPGFNGAQIYAMDKAALAGGTMKLQRIESVNPPLAEGVAYSVQPATSPAAAEWSSADNGTEYALSALEFTGGFDNRIASWAFTNTQSLTTASPAVHVSHSIVSSEVYGAPPKALQRPGPYPLGQSLKDKLPPLNTNDDRMNQTVYSGGKLWSGLNTAVKTNNGPATTGIAYFVVDPTASGGPEMSNQGYVAVNRSTVMFPSIGVTPGASKAAMVFTLVGPSFYPSVAYVRLTGSGATSGAVKVFAAGTKPADGFTGYPQEDPVDNGIERWGDYSAAVADADGTIWTAGEYIPGTFGFPPFLGNWGTAIGTVG